MELLFECDECVKATVGKSDGEKNRLHHKAAYERDSRYPGEWFSTTKTCWQMMVLRVCMEEMQLAKEMLKEGCLTNWRQ